jgi:dienelactone hydrolase
MRFYSSLLLIFIATHAARGQGVRQLTLPKPWGEWTPAVTTHLIADSTRSDAQTGARPILVRLWYPTDAQTGMRRPYMHEAVADAWRGTMPAADGFERGIATHAITGAPLSSARPRWPVLLFSHGRSFPVDNYQIALEYLASRGWIVAAISHPNEEALTVLPDGRHLPFSGPTWKHENERADVLMSVVDELVRDAGRVIDELERMNGDAASGFAARMDLDRGVGYAGHSLGGAAAIWTLQRDIRVKAAASWEGQVYRAADRPLHVRGPVLYIFGGANRAELMGTQLRPASGGGPVYELVMHGAWHVSFGDMLYIYRHYADRSWHDRHRREMDPLRANQISNDYLHEFFSSHLLGTEPDLLWPDSREESESYVTWNYPEVELRIFSR